MLNARQTARRKLLRMRLMETPAHVRRKSCSESAMPTDCECVFCLCWLPIADCLLLIATGHPECSRGPQLTHLLASLSVMESFGRNIEETKYSYSVDLILQRDYLLTRLPHLKCIRLGSVRASHLPFKMHHVGLRAFQSPYINACRVNSNPLFKNINQ